MSLYDKVMCTETTLLIGVEQTETGTHTHIQLNMYYMRDILTGLDFRLSVM